MLTTTASAKPAALRLDLPYPPSVNNLYYTHGGRRHVSKEGRAYHVNVTLACGVQTRGHPGFGGHHLGYILTVCPPDRRKRDLSNVIKAVEDALTKAGIWDDDSQVDEITVRRGSSVKGGLAEMWISAL